MKVCRDSVLKTCSISKNMPTDPLNIPLKGSHPKTNKYESIFARCCRILTYISAINEPYSWRETPHEPSSMGKKSIHLSTFHAAMPPARTPGLAGHFVALPSWTLFVPQLLVMDLQDLWLFLWLYRRSEVMIVMVDCYFFFLPC